MFVEMLLVYGILLIRVYFHLRIRRKLYEKTY